ncbi:hypothetical protein O6H91_04G084100 [Diphasiastrum complanatum]|nr:hypothetical protein O6H91_Y484500 [Diphasiastrum complanatum]KAJ7559417.1 hypothetical protein O6H91_04G084100 [Diphasiastrum complanatum]
MVNAMQRELQKVWVQVQELEEACIWARMEINNLHLRVDSKGKSWPSKVYTKFAAKVLSLKEDAAQESQSQQQLQMHIKRLEKQLAESKAALIKAKKDMIKERKGREVLELVCAELAREIRQDKLDPDKLKQNRPQSNHQAETEGKILRMSEEWREEKVQVKVTEAKFEVAHDNLSIGSFEQKVKGFLAATTRRGRRF